MTRNNKTLFGLKSFTYFGVIALFSAASSSYAAEITWNGAADGVSTFNEGNWVVTDDTGSAALNGLVGSAPPANFVNGATDVEADVIVGGSATAGGPLGAGNHFDLGDGFSLTVQDNAIFRTQTGARGIRGVLDGATETVILQDNAELLAQFFLNLDASLSGASNLTLRGSGVGTVNNSTIDLATDWTGTISWINFDITGSSIFSNITVGGEAAVAGVNVLVNGDGSSSTLTLVPEPSSLALLALGGLAVARRRRA